MGLLYIVNFYFNIHPYSLTFLHFMYSMASDLLLNSNVFIKNRSKLGTSLYFCHVVVPKHLHIEIHSTFLSFLLYNTM